MEPHAFHLEARPLPKKRTRLQIYRATITTKLCYALETLYLTSAQRTKLNAFQLKGLRRILKMDTTYINRENTNRKVYKAANIELRATPKTRDKAKEAETRFHQPPIAQISPQERVFGFARSSMLAALYTCRLVFFAINVCCVHFRMRLSPLS